MEKELLSSTSDEVCELWNGKNIVRTKGRLLGHHMATLFWTTNEGILDPDEHYRVDGIVDQTQPTIRHMLDAAPSLTLNLRSARAPRLEAWLLALLGLACQVAVLAVTGAVAYLWSPDGEKGQQAVVYGFICYFVGTITLFIAVLGCGYSIDAATAEQTLRRTFAGSSLEIVPVRLQLACTVGDQHFRPFAIFNPPGNQQIRFSEWKPDGKNHE